MMTPNYGAASTYTQYEQMPSYGRSNPGYPSGRGGWIQAMTLGAIDDGVSPGLSPAALGVASVFGSVVGGAVLGYLAEGWMKGAYVGSAFSGGLTSLADALLFSRMEQGGAALVMGVAGLAMVGSAIYQSPAFKFGR